MKTPRQLALFPVLLCAGLTFLSLAHEPRRYASAIANPSGPPGHVASLIMSKPMVAADSGKLLRQLVSSRD